MLLTLSKAKQAPAVTTAGKLPPVTLFLKEFPLVRPAFGERAGVLEDHSYQISVALTAQLNSDGFVTDNGGFIEGVQRIPMELRGNREKLAKLILDLAKGRIGNKLNAVIVTIRTPHDGNTGTIVWSANTQEELAFDSATEQQLDLKRLIVRATLVDDHVCGGYDGQFEADLHLRLLRKTDLPHDLGLMEQRIRGRFATGTFKASCEELSYGLAAIACEFYGNRLLATTARVYNTTGYAEACWRTSDQIPPFPRKATRQERNRTLADRRRREIPKKYC